MRLKVKLSPYCKKTLNSRQKIWNFVLHLYTTSENFEPGSSIIRSEFWKKGY